MRRDRLLATNGCRTGEHFVKERAVAACGGVWLLHIGDPRALPKCPAVRLHRRSLDMAIDSHSLFCCFFQERIRMRTPFISMLLSQRQFSPAAMLCARLSRGCQERPTLELVILSLLQESLCCYNAMLSGYLEPQFLVLFILSLTPREISVLRLSRSKSRPRSACSGA